MWSIKKYITIISFTILFTIIAFLYLQNKSYKCENRRLQEEAIVSHQTISKQNAELKRKELDLENYKKQKPIIEKEIVTIYKDIIKIEKDNSCENQLLNYNNLLKTFSDRNKRS